MNQKGLTAVADEAGSAVKWPQAGQRRERPFSAA